MQDDNQIANEWMSDAIDDVDSVNLGGADFESDAGCKQDVESHPNDDLVEVCLNISFRAQKDMIN